MSNNTNVTTTTAAKPVWMVAVNFQVEPLDEMVDRTRSADGRFLKVNCKLEVKTATQSASNIAMANLYGCDADELFAGKR